jgi:tetratricopeptide (TPR) repeat protein
LVEELERRGYLGELDAAAKARAKAAIDEHFDLLASYLEKRIGESRRMYLATVTPPGLHYEVIRTRQNDGSRDTVMRFWYREHEGRMQLVDCEDASLGYRASTLVLGLVAPQELPWVKPLLSLMEKINQAGSESTFEVSVTTANEVEALLAANPPDDLKAFALKLKAERLIMQRKHADALKVIKEFASFEPKSPWADFLRGLALMNLHRGFEAVTAFNRYGETAGWDATVHEYLGWSYYYQGDEKSALEHAKKGLDLNKDAYGCLLTAVCASKPADIAGLAGYFKDTFDAEYAYEYVMEQIVEMDDPAIPKAVLALLEKELPKSRLVATYRRKLKVSAE